MNHTAKLSELERRANAGGDLLVRDFLEDIVRYFVNGVQVDPAEYEKHPADQTIDLVYSEDW